jgi:NitT/TauT family transport system substrate-binding protein
MSTPSRDPGPRPTRVFYSVISLVALVLVGFALYRGRGRANKEAVPDARTPGRLTAFAGAVAGPAPLGASVYRKLDDRTVRMAINVRSAWAPVVYANGGLRAGKEWSTAEGQSFRLDLVLIDDPLALRDAFGAGSVQLAGTTADVLPLLVESLHKDARALPRVVQQVAWSDGGDGIVGRGVDSIGDLRGKTILLVQGSPSSTLVLSALADAGVSPTEVTLKYVPDAFRASAAFSADKRIAARAAWAPDLRELARQPGNKLLASTSLASPLIADVWFARADFARDEPGIVEALVRGFLDAADALAAPEARAEAVKLLAAGFHSEGMLEGFHFASYADNWVFFVDPGQFARIWEAAKGNVGVEQVVDLSVLRKLGPPER